VVVTEIGPAWVGIHAVTLTGFHAVRGTQNQVPTCTTILSLGGAVRRANAFTNRETLDWLDSAMRRVVSLRIQWYDMTRSLHVR
jgi:hypothetical protein